MEILVLRFQLPGHPERRTTYLCGLSQDPLPGTQEGAGVCFHARGHEAEGVVEMGQNELL